MTTATVHLSSWDPAGERGALEIVGDRVGLRFGKVCDGISKLRCSLANYKNAFTYKQGLSRSDFAVVTNHNREKSVS